MMEKKEIHQSITEFHQSERIKQKISAKVEDIQMVYTNKSYDGTLWMLFRPRKRKGEYKKGLDDDLENKLDTLLTP